MAVSTPILKTMIKMRHDKKNGNTICVIEKEFPIKFELKEGSKKVQVKGKKSNAKNIYV